MTKLIVDDSNQMAWLHSDDVLETRQQCLLILLKAFGGALNEDGSPVHDTRAIYGACHDYISHGNRDPKGIIKYYQEIRESYSL